MKHNPMTEEAFDQICFSLSFSFLGTDSIKIHSGLPRGEDLYTFFLSAVAIPSPNSDLFFFSLEIIVGQGLSVSFSSDIGGCEKEIPMCINIIAFSVQNEK